MIERLSQHFAHVALALGEFIQEEDAVVCERHRPRHGDVAAANPPHIRDGLVGWGLKLLFTPPHSPHYNWAHSLEVCRSRLL
jgi:hypothetical protein